VRLAYALIPLLSISGQQFPDAAKLLYQRSSALKNYYSYQYTEVMSGATSMTTSLQVVNPDKYRMELKAGSMEAMTIVANGQSVWMYMPVLKKYSKVQAVDDMMSTLAAKFGGRGTVEDPELTANAKVIRSEVLEIEGQSHDCWVVESRAAKIALPASLGQSLLDVVRTLWIDKTLGIDLQTTLSARVNVTDIRSKTTKTSIKFNEHFPDSLFVFTPPPDAVEADELIPGMNILAAAKPAAPTLTSSSAGPEPQAFVPNLTPVERTDAVHPRATSAHGMVQLLLTIDPGGSVVKAEPLTGPKSLHEPAVETVLHWKYRPVIRKGQPVYSYTEAMVDFNDHSKPLKPENMNFDIVETMAYAQKNAALKSKYPRSPEQVLADLEQDRGSATGIERSFALPGLAKAALDAGALEKAAAYANELLRLGPKDPNHGQGVHDGNMVLGLISLRRGDLDPAKTYLLESGKSTGSATLDSFGPNVKLAKELLEKGERDAVLQYFSLCRTFWKMGGEKLNEWSAAVRQGSMPEFGANLAY
jgi:outer membrane lipoprotein-sorting protein